VNAVSAVTSTDPAAKPPRWLGVVLPAVLAAAYLAARSQFWAIIPVYDSRWNYEALLAAKHAPFDLLNYTVDGHLSQGFMLLLGVGFGAYGTNYFLFNLWVTAWSLFCISIFMRLVKRLANSNQSPLETVLLTALFAFHPTVFANSLGANFDLGVLTFSLATLLALLQDKRWLAIALALLLAFTKETSFAILPILFAFTAIRQPAGARRAWVRTNLPVLTIPAIAIMWFVMYKTVVRSEPAFWLYYNSASPAAGQSSTTSVAASIASFLGLIFVINFNWILTATLASSWVALLLKLRHDNTRQALAAATPLMLLLLATTAALLLVRPYSNARYVMLLVPLMLLASAVPLGLLVSNGTIRSGLYAALLALFAWQNVRSIDPVSRAYFGTVPFGSHQLLNMTVRTGECCGYGLDQLAYNTEFTRIPRLLQLAIDDLDFETRTTISMPQRGQRMLFSAINSATGEMTLDPANSFTPDYREIDQILSAADPPAQLYYFALPNFNNAANLIRLAQLYGSNTPHVYAQAGYTLTVHEFQR
jgi:hypothetical protein